MASRWASPAGGVAAPGWRRGSAPSGRDPAGTGLDWSDLPAERLAGRRGGGIGRGGGHWRCWLGYEGIRGTGVKYEWCEMFFQLGGGILLNYVELLASAFLEAGLELVQLFALEERCASRSTLRGAHPLGPAPRVDLCQDRIFGILISQKMAIVLTSPRITVS